MEVRLDKWLDIACLFKTRSGASRACTTGKVAVNGVAAKPHRRVAVGDRIDIERRDWQQTLEVVRLAERHLAKSDARELYRDLTPPRPPADPMRRLLREPAAHRETGSGRPTKRERRRLDRWRGR